MIPDEIERPAQPREAAMWTPAAVPPALHPEELHVWLIDLDVDRAQLVASSRILSDGELGRAARLSVERCRRNFTVCRSSLRQLLGGYSGSKPQLLELDASANGKMQMKPGGNKAGLRFNVSHSGDLALIAVTTAGPVGVDIERKRSIWRMESLARFSFSQSELASWHEVPHEQRADAFFGVWTRKEAFLKATGRGLGLGRRLGTFEVTVLPDVPASVVSVDGDRQQAREWSMTALRPAQGYVGAVAVKCRRFKLRLLRKAGGDAIA